MALRKLQQFQPIDHSPGIEDVELPEEAESELCYKFNLIFNSNDCQNMFYSKSMPVCGT